MSTQKKIALITVVVLLLALYLVFVWPTPYQTWKGPNGIYYRRNRVTHQVEYEIGGGWFDVAVDPAVAAGSKPP